MLGALLALLAGCTSARSGTPQPHPSSTAARPALCPGPAATAIVSCLRTSLTQFWTKTLGRPVVDKVVADPRASQVPADCRGAIAAGTAFSCPVDDTVYLTAPYIGRLQAAEPTADAPYRFAATLAHEMGHIVQFAVHDPTATHAHNSLAQSREVEQQADCLSGVWAASVGINAATFARAAATVFQIVDNAREERTHGTPAQRQAAIARGAAGRTPQACKLAVR